MRKFFVGNQYSRLITLIFLFSKNINNIEMRETTPLYSHNQSHYMISMNIKQSELRHKR
jgi:hypothetical protein